MLHKDYDCKGSVAKRKKERRKEKTKSLVMSLKRLGTRMN
jgi:hypothetical protein